MHNTITVSCQLVKAAHTLNGKYIRLPKIRCQCVLETGYEYVMGWSLLLLAQCGLETMWAWPILACSWVGSNNRWLNLCIFTLYMSGSRTAGANDAHKSLFSSVVVLRLACECLHTHTRTHAHVITLLVQCFSR